ncbi:MAG: aminotransferase class IV [Clostridia bacterium]|nr:aminotransferase class IV [Clostridia bacterium]
MKDLGYYNGRYAPISEMTVPMNDRSSWFGDGVYDATYCRNHKIYMLDAHIDRFFSSASQLDIKIPYTKAELAALLSELVLKVDSPEQFVYWQITRADEGKNRSHDYDPALIPGNLWVTLTPRPIHNPYDRIKVITLADTRFLHCNIKTLNLIPSVMATRKAVAAGCYEAVLHRDGRVTECAHSNVSIIKDGVFRTAPTDNLILPGIARANLIRFCGQLGIPVDETPFTLDEMMNADEIIVSSSGSFALGVYEIDGKRVGGKAPQLLRQLQDTALRDFELATNV